MLLPQDAVKLGEVHVQGPPASPTRGTGMTSALLMEEDGGEGDRKLCCCVLCCRLCYRRCCGVIVVSARMHTLTNMWHTISIILSFFLQNKLKGCYTVIASYRPVFKYHGTLGVQSQAIILLLLSYHASVYMKTETCPVLSWT